MGKTLLVRRSEKHEGNKTGSLFGLNPKGGHTMNMINKMELSQLRAAMWKVFQRVAKTPQDDREIEYFVSFMDRHQEILAGDGREMEID
jgi:hypothetical protein